MKKELLLFSLLATISLILPACNAIGSSGLIKVGGIGELSGDSSAVGASYKKAAELAVKEINALGGLEVGGKKYRIQLILEDNTSQVDWSASIAKKLIGQKNVTAIIGPNLSRFAIPASEIAESLEVPLITPWSTNPRTTLDARTGQPKKYVFRVGLSDVSQGRVLAKFALGELSAKKVAVLYDKDADYNASIAESFKQAFEEGGGQMVASETYTSGNMEFSDPLTRIKDANPDLILLPNDSSEIPLQAQQARRLGITIPFLGSDAWDDLELIERCGVDCEGLIFSVHYVVDNPTPANRVFVAAYQAEYGSQPDDVAALTYDAFGLLWKALQTAGKVDRQAVRDALANISKYEGVAGVIQFKEGSGDPIKSAMIVQIKSGKFVFFGNADP